MIAALYVDPKGCYAELDGVDPWPESRDARLYAGPYSVVAHPPCASWCRLAGFREATHGYKRGEDGGTFEAALNAVRTYGGVLEHPAYSDAWLKYDLPPPPWEGWQKGICGGWSCHVEQGRYGHRAKKATWLYAYGMDEPPSLNWGRQLDGKSEALVSWCGNKTKKRWNYKPTHWGADKRYASPDSPAHWLDGEKRARIGKRAAQATPPEFRDLLISIARQANVS